MITDVLRSLHGIKLVAATKNQPVERINQVITEGVSIIGENYVQEAADKFPRILPVQKHFIGHLQSNKVKAAVALFDCIQSIDSEKILGKMSDKAKRMPIFLQVNLGNEDTKYGFSIEEVEAVAKRYDNYQGIFLSGIMAVVPLQKSEKNKPLFRQLHNTFLRLQCICPTLRELSMGTSHDYKAAIEEGATMVRLGTALFGSR